MHDCTRFRLAMLANGFAPTLNNCKRPVESNWHKTPITEELVLAWDRSTFRTTGMKIDGDLAVIDVDANDAGMVNELAAAMSERFPALFASGLVRHAGGPREAWFARVETPFKRLSSRRWFRGGNPHDAATPDFLVECFGSQAARQFGVDGPHSRNKATGAIERVYGFAAGASPATVPRASLPVLPKRAFADACDLFDAIAKKASLTIVPEENGVAADTVYDLAPATVFENDAGPIRGLDGLEAEFHAARHAGCSLRITSSFLGHGHNASKCIVGFSQRRGCIYVHDFETGQTHMPAGSAPAPMFGFLKRIKAGS
jgi:hypothetical protein